MEKQRLTDTRRENGTKINRRMTGILTWIITKRIQEADWGRIIRHINFLNNGRLDQPGEGYARMSPLCIKCFFLKKENKIWSHSHERSSPHLPNSRWNLSTANSFYQIWFLPWAKIIQTDTGNDCKTHSSVQFISKNTQILTRFSFEPIK